MAARLAGRIYRGARARGLRLVEPAAAPLVRRRHDQRRRRDLADPDRAAARVRRRTRRAHVSCVRGVRRRAQLFVSRKDGFPMTRTRACIALVALAGALVAPPLGAVGQDSEFRFESYNPAVRILRDYTLRPGDTVRQVVVVGGNAKIEGHVTQDVAVILGRVELTSTAVIDGQLVAVAGSVDVAEGAKVSGDFVVVGDADTPASFQPRGEHIVVGLAGFGEAIRSIVPWLTHGLVL